MITIDEFNTVQICVGRILSVDEFPEARKPSYKLKIDLGPEIGIKRSCAQLTRRYSPGDLVNRQVLCVVNLPPRRIGPEISEVLTLGVPDTEGEPILVIPERAVPLGGRLY